MSNCGSIGVSVKVIVQSMPLVEAENFSTVTHCTDIDISQTVEFIDMVL